MTAARIQKIASIAEIISAIAVVISLLYVGYEVRQNTNAVRSTAYQSIHDAEDLFWQSISIDPMTSETWDLGLAGGLEVLSPAQRAPVLSERPASDLSVSERSLPEAKARGRRRAVGRLVGVAR